MYYAQLLLYIIIITTQQYIYVPYARLARLAHSCRIRQAVKNSRHCVPPRTWHCRFATNTGKICATHGPRHLPLEKKWLQKWLRTRTGHPSARQLPPGNNSCQKWPRTYTAASQPGISPAKMAVQTMWLLRGS